MEANSVEMNQNGMLLDQIYDQSFTTVNRRFAHHMVVDQKLWSKQERLQKNRN